jgi:hypothetical protein
VETRPVRPIYSGHADQHQDALGVRRALPGVDATAIDTDDRSPLGKFILQMLAAVAELDRAFIKRTHTGYKSYRASFAAGRVGKSRHSKSGKDLAVGRPKKVFLRSVQGVSK